MKTHRRSVLLFLALIFRLPSAGAADWVADFYTAAGASVNVTAPQAVTTQAVVGFSGGGLSWRVPNRGFSPLQITPPSIKAGCGGIDAYLGGFSFPNKEQFVQALKNFGQAAIGYLFQLALRSLAPEIAVTLQEINDIAQKVNQFGMGSCQAAQETVDALASWAGWQQTSTAEGARHVGEFVDSFAANFGFKAEKSFAETMEEKYRQNYGKPRSNVGKDDVAREKWAGPFNALRWAMDHNGLDMSEDEKDLIMSLVGPTLIVCEEVAKDGDRNLSGDCARAKTIDFDELVGLTGYWDSAPTAFQVLTCDASPECVRPFEKSETHATFSKLVWAVLMKVRDKVWSREPVELSAQEQVILKLTSVPLYRVAAMSAGSGVSAIVAEQLLADMADHAALDAAARMVNYYLAASDKALSTLTEIPPDLVFKLEAMQSRIQDIRLQMQSTMRQYYANKGNPFEKIDLLDKAERMMYARLNVSLAANARFGIHQ
jgi:conjugative transfer pilus assembly protein TraH